MILEEFWIWIFRPNPTFYRTGSNAFYLNTEPDPTTFHMRIWIRYPAIVTEFTMINWIYNRFKICTHYWVNQYASRKHAKNHSVTVGTRMMALGWDCSPHRCCCFGGCCCCCCWYCSQSGTEIKIAMIIHIFGFFSLYARGNKICNLLWLNT